MGKLAEQLKKQVEEKLQVGLEAFAEGLVEDAEHPVLTGITRGNWHPSVNNPKKVSNYFGYNDLDWLAAAASGKILVSEAQAKKVALDFKWELGDEVIWTNSLDHIGELEQRHMFFDQIVENARQKAQRAIRAKRRTR